jgi:hypothetical protein
MKTGIVTGLTLVLGVALCAIFLGPGHLESAEQLVVTAKHLHKVPALLDDPVWQQVQPVEVSVRGRGSFAEEEVMVTMKAAYTDGLHLQVERSLKSVTTNYDGQKWTHERRRTVALLLNHPVKVLPPKGCTVVSHADFPKVICYPDRCRKRGQHWKAAVQSLPFR